MKNPALYAFVLGALGVVGSIVLVAINKQVPPELWQATFLSVGAGAGVAYNAPPKTP